MVINKYSFIIIHGSNVKFSINCTLSIYLYIGVSDGSLYQMTKWTLSPVSGGEVSQGSLATSPATASVPESETGKKKIKECLLYYNNNIYKIIEYL